MFIKWLIESSGQKWSSIPAFGKYLSNKLSTIYKELPLEQKQLVDIGSLANWDIILLTKVLQAPYTKLNKSKVDIENKELLKIRLNYLKFIKLKESYKLYLSNEEFQTYFNIIKKSITILDEII
ncbi:hypothetical protein ACTFIZ_003194 [Dictyostelium cf. discoideum]